MGTRIYGVDAPNTSNAQNREIYVDSNGYLHFVSSGSIQIMYPDENERILNADDAVTTINYVDSNKDQVQTVETSSASIGSKVVDTYNNSGATTLVITRSVTV
ncbi:MAG: hypothetical protein ABEK36_04365 [Candidatus Aenigmatarchaeota archaeon]